MTVLQDGVIAFLAAMGMSAVLWVLAGALLRTDRPVIPGLTLVLPLWGEAPAMEHDVRELRRLQHSLPGAKIVLADCGMSEEARQLARYLAARERNAALAENGTISMETFHERGTA